MDNSLEEYRTAIGIFHSRTCRLCGHFLIRKAIILIDVFHCVILISAVLEIKWNSLKHFLMILIY